MASNCFRLKEDEAESFFTQAMHLPGSSESVEWSPMIITQFGGLCNWGKNFLHKISHGVAVTFGVPYHEARTFCRTQLNRLNMLMFARKLNEARDKKCEADAPKASRKLMRFLNPHIKPKAATKAGRRGRPRKAVQ